MKATFAIGSFSPLFEGDGKRHPIIGMVILLTIAIVIYCFDRWVIKK